MIRDHVKELKKTSHRIEYLGGSLHGEKLDVREPFHQGHGVLVDTSVPGLVLVEEYSRCVIPGVLMLKHSSFWGWGDGSVDSWEALN
ncbi:hypothetical protein AB1L42_19290 [Thalassoglobus sp. JC818]|uniref:hypothetical protein n=1 Tax=Thalassoglobus sp. JC818 TaxID=3232136 RepID=UPI00345977E3